MKIENVEKLTERFEKDFQATLTPDNSFYLNTKGITSSDLSVNIPQSMNVITGPADSSSNSALTVVDYEEGNKVVTQKQFKTNAIRIIDYKEFFTAQDMRADAMEEMKNFIDTKIGNFAAYKFAPASTTLKSTGTATRASEIIGGATAVKTFVKADFIALKKAMAKTNMTGKWYALISPDVLADLFAIDDFVKADSLGVAQSRLLNGEFADILGIRFFVRYGSYGGSVGFAGTTGTTAATKADVYGVVGAADSIGATTVGGIVCWNQSALYSNRGMIKTYVDAQNPIYQSDILSMQYTFGVEPIRTDNTGILFMAEGL